MDQQAGVNVVRRAIVSQLAGCAKRWRRRFGCFSRVAELKPNEGFNAATGEYGNLVDAGIIDPVKVTRSALWNAASIAGMVLTTETLVADKVEGKTKSSYVLAISQNLRSIFGRRFLLKQTV